MSNRQIQSHLKKNCPPAPTRRPSVGRGSRFHAVTGASVLYTRHASAVAVVQFLCLRHPRTPILLAFGLLRLVWPIRVGCTYGVRTRGGELHHPSASLCARAAVSYVVVTTSVLLCSLSAGCLFLFLSCSNCFSYRGTALPRSSCDAFEATPTDFWNRLKG